MGECGSAINCLQCLLTGKVMEVRNLAQGGDKGDPLHGERLALAQRDLAVTGMMVFLLVSNKCTFARWCSPQIIQ